MILDICVFLSKIIKEKERGERKREGEKEKKKKKKAVYTSTQPKQGYILVFTLYTLTGKCKYNCCSAKKLNTVLPGRIS